MHCHHQVVHSRIQQSKRSVSSTKYPPLRYGHFHLPCLHSWSLLLCVCFNTKWDLFVGHNRDCGPQKKKVSFGQGQMLQGMPSELVLEIFRWLDPCDLCMLKQVEAPSSPPFATPELEFWHTSTTCVCVIGWMASACHCFRWYGIPCLSLSLSTLYHLVANSIVVCVCVCVEFASSFTGPKCLWMEKQKRVATIYVDDHNPLNTHTHTHTVVEASCKEGFW